LANLCCHVMSICLAAGLCLVRWLDVYNRLDVSRTTRSICTALQVPQLVSKVCRQLARVLAQSGSPAAALLALHDCHGAAMRQQFAAVVRGKQLALARRADAEGPHAVTAAGAGLRAVEAQLRHAWVDMQQLPLQRIEVRGEVEHITCIQQRCRSGGCRCAPHHDGSVLSMLQSLHVLNTSASVPAGGGY